LVSLETSVLSDTPDSSGIEHFPRVPKHPIWAQMGVQKGLFWNHQVYTFGPVYALWTSSTPKCTLGKHPFGPHPERFREKCSLNRLLSQMGLPDWVPKWAHLGLNGPKRASHRVPRRPEGLFGSLYLGHLIKTRAHDEALCIRY